MKILVDMNLSPGWVEFLVDAGFEAAHWSQVGLSNASDAEVMRWAAEREYVVLTSDLDFGSILAATRERRPSVLQLRSGLLAPSAVGSAVLAAIRQSHRELSEGGSYIDRCSEREITRLAINRLGGLKKFLFVAYW
jgi:predicted nuclease of predicted toxin-antitoxin system